MAAPDMAPDLATAAPAPAGPARRLRLIFLLPLLIFGLLAALFFVRLFAGDASRVPSALIGRPAPALALPPLEGLLIGGAPAPGLDPANLRAGKVTILNVFASWCGPCRVEHPYLVAMAQSDAARQGRIALVGLNYKDEPENARRFLGALGNPYSAVGADRSGRAAIEWGVYGVPETYVVGPDGIILRKHVGPLDSQAAEALMREALAAAK